MCCFDDESKRFCTLTEKVAPGLARSVVPTFLSLASTHAGNEIKIMSGQISIGPKEL